MPRKGFAVKRAGGGAIGRTDQFAVKLGSYAQFVSN